MYTFDNLNHALIGMSKVLLKEGVSRKTRGFDCIEMPHPVLICIKDPSDRYVNIPERKWNKILPFAESLWLALGLNNLDSLPGRYVKNLYNFSDDGQHWRAGYGPRIRAFSGVMTDYAIGEPEYRNIWSGVSGVVDQLKFVIDSFKRDINTRQAVISISDPAKDCFEENGCLKVTKDQNCTRSLHFQVNTEGEMDMIVDMRSNDLLWGFSAVNVFNFSLMQEYVANIVGVPVGKYYHKADNLHFYKNFIEKIEKFSVKNEVDYVGFGKFQYKDKIESLEQLDKLLYQLYKYEQILSKDHYFIANFNNDLFTDWGRVFYHYWSKEDVEFKNPYLNRLFYHDGE